MASCFEYVRDKLDTLPTKRQVVRDLEANILSRILWASVAVLLRTSLGQDIMLGETLTYAVLFVPPSYVTSKHQTILSHDGILIGSAKYFQNTISACLTRHADTDFPLASVSTVGSPILNIPSTPVTTQTPPQPAEQIPEDMTVVVRVNRDTFTIAPVHLQIQLFENMNDG